jgi:divalent metal cation (Fe/Co/Zn/Cd) transporter
VLAGASSITFGALAGSLALVGSGASVVIDLSSSLVLVWRFRRHEHPTAERIAHLVAAIALLVLAVSLGIGGALRLASGTAPTATAPGLAVASASVLVLPLIAVRKYRVAPQVPSPALRVDAHITTVGATTALLALLGLGLTEAGVGWADAAAAVVIACIAAMLGVGEIRQNRRH